MKAIYDTASDFAELRQTDCIYVDKTAYLHQMISTRGRKMFFISRPRRFGKSLMISTLKYIFQGRRDLFKGTYIDTQTDYDWKTYPVIHLDFASVDVTTREYFNDVFTSCVKTAIEDTGYPFKNFAYDEAKNPTVNFREAIVDLSKEHGPVVVLIDEYDAPIDHALANPEMAEYVRGRLAPFYATLKSLNARLRFMMMTGVAKLAKVSAFSSMNSPADITTAPAYAALLGYTEDELEANFSEHIHRRAEAMKMSYEAYRAELRHWFNGYRFTRAETKVYNPVSIAQTLISEDLTIEAPWSATGRPTMLATFLKTHDILSLDFEHGISANLQSLEASSEFKNLDATAILYQTGYLTIVEGSLNSTSIKLGFPDEEVRRDMYAFLTDIRAQSECWCQRALIHLENGELDPFLDALPALYAGLPAHAKDGKLPESHYQGILKVVMEAGGFGVTCEQVQSSKKRSDLVVNTGRYCYIFEFKIGKRVTARTAVKQIIDRKYAAPHLGKGVPVFAIGLVFDPIEHTLRDTAWKQL